MSGQGRLGSSPQDGLAATKCGDEAKCLEPDGSASGGETRRTPDASRDSKTPGSREPFGVRVSLAPLFASVSNSSTSGNEAPATIRRQDARFYSMRDAHHHKLSYSTS